MTVRFPAKSYEGPVETLINVTQMGETEMKITTVSASVRYSKALGHGQHKTVEISAEATLDTQESWQDAQSQLYSELGRQLKSLWAMKS